MTTLWQVAALAPAAYLLGSVPFGLLVGLAKGIDVRKAGSGNIGATNVARLLGGRYFALVFSLDLLKGLIPVAVAGILLRRQCDPEAWHWQQYALWLSVALAAVLGHLFSIFLKFKGGKGVATGAGVILGVFPYLTYPALAALVVWLAMFAVWRYVSAASIGAAVAIPLAYVGIGLAAHWDITGRQLPLLFFTVIVAALIVYKHRANITRLRAGTEKKVGAKG